MLHEEKKQETVYSHIHNFGRLVNANGNAVVRFGRNQNFFQCLSSALSSLAGLLDEKLLKSHDDAGSNSTRSR